MKVLLNHNGNRGYGPDQVEGITLADLLEAVENAIDEFGADAEVVTHQLNNGHGASYGTLAKGFEMFESTEIDDDEMYG